ncbi:hypothetical protein OC834_006460 [Tilletia horrida]|nr:hypothetical protein OC834_006460 [Tilletia horrida]
MPSIHATFYTAFIIPVRFVQMSESQTGSESSSLTSLESSASAERLRNDQDLRESQKLNHGKFSYRKMWLSNALAGSRRKRRRTLRTLRTYVHANNEVDYVASHLAHYILQAERASPTPVTISTRPQPATLISTLGAASKRASSSALAIFYEELLRYVRSGTSRKIKAGSSSDRFVAVQAIATHGPAFCALFPFQPQSLDLERGSLNYMATQWATRVKTVIKTGLWKAMSRIIDAATKQKDSWKARKHEDEDLRQAALSRLDHVRRYKKWLDKTSMTGTPPPADLLQDEGVNRAHTILAPLVKLMPSLHDLDAVGDDGDDDMEEEDADDEEEGEEEDDDEDDDDEEGEEEDDEDGGDNGDSGRHHSLSYLIKQQSHRFFEVYLAVQASFASEVTLVKANAGTSLPLRRSLIPVHCQLTATTLAQLFPDVAYKSYAKRGKKESKTAHKRRRDAERLDAFKTIFKTSAAAFASTDRDGGRWTLGSSVLTDGYSLSVQLVRKDAKEFSSKSRSTRKSAKEQRQERFPDVSTVEPQVLLDVLKRVEEHKTSLVCGDVGKGTILYATAESVSSISGYKARKTTWDAKEVPKAFKYTAARRQRELGTNQFRARRQRFERNVQDPRLRQALATFRSDAPHADTRTFSRSAIEARLTLIAPLFRALADLFQAPIYRTLRMQAYSRRLRSEKRFVQDLQQLFGADAVFVIGSWQGYNLPASAPSMGGVRLCNILWTHGHQVLLVDEYNTSKKCPLCTEVLSHPKNIVRANPRLLRRGFLKEETPWALLECTSAQCTQGRNGRQRLWDRNRVATMNFRRIVDGYGEQLRANEERERPADLQRASAPVE